MEDILEGCAKKINHLSLQSPNNRCASHATKVFSMCTYIQMATNPLESCSCFDSCGRMGVCSATVCVSGVYPAKVCVSGAMVHVHVCVLGELWCALRSTLVPVVLVLVVLVVAATTGLAVDVCPLVGGREVGGAGPVCPCGGRGGKEVGGAGPVCPCGGRGGKEVGGADSVLVHAAIGGVVGAGLAL